MLNAKQIAAIITAELNQHPSQATPDTIESAAGKIAELVKPDYASHTMAAALENEVTSELINMVAVTILATLIEQEGGGRTNITFSPGAMQQTLTDWGYTCDVSGMDRTIRIIPKRPDTWLDTTRVPAEEKLESLLMQETVRDAGVKPQAEAHEYNRPEWVIAFTEPEGSVAFSRQHDRAAAERELRAWRFDANARIENRWCLHTDCPSNGCNHDPELRDPQKA